jgi:hypothetical protein
MTAAIFLGALASCSQSEPRIPGSLYQLQETVTTSTCSAMPVGTTATTTVSVIQVGCGGYKVFFQNIGDDCLGFLDGETLTATGCVGQVFVDGGAVQVTDAGLGEEIAWQLEATMTPSTISGTQNVQVTFPPGLCEFTETFTGTP